MDKIRFVSLSFDDGTIYDKRFIELLNKYNLKATFNLNSGLNNFVWYYENKTPIKRFDLKEVVDLYNGHEVASHSLTHPYFSSLSKEKIIEESSSDIKNLSEIFGYKIEGFAFPFDDQTEENIQVVKENNDLNYIRFSYLDTSYLPKDRYHIHINALYDDENIYEELEKFSNNNLDISLFVIAGHSYEFEVKNDWEKIEKLLKFLSLNKKIKVVTTAEAVRLIF